VDVNARPDDPESTDAAPIGATTLDVTPRTGPEPSTSGRGLRSRTIFGLVALAVIAVGLGLVLFNELRDASTFFYNVDEAVAKQDQLAGQRFRVQGNVVDGTVHETTDGVDFTLKYNGVEIGVTHHGDPPELFGPKIPVVLEGEFEGDAFVSDEILIRHDNEYDEENPDRVDKAEKDANA